MVTPCMKLMIHATVLWFDEVPALIQEDREIERTFAVKTRKTKVGGRPVRGVFTFQSMASVLSITAEGSVVVVLTWNDTSICIDLVSTLDVSTIIALFTRINISALALNEHGLFGRLPVTVALTTKDDNITAAKGRLL